MALLRAREASMRLFRPMLADHGLTEQQWRVLRSLTSFDQPVDAGTLVDSTFLLAPSLSRILANLDERQLVHRAPDPDDQRRSLISLTVTGRALVAEVAPESEARYRSIEQSFGPDRLARLLDELHVLAELELEMSQ